MSLADVGARAIDLVRDNHAYAAPICFVLAFAESLAFVSLIVPSSVLLLGIGGLVPVSELSFGEVWAGTAVGAGLGDWFSYWLGFRFKDCIVVLWPFSRHPGMLDRTRTFFARWGAVGVFGGRFLGPMRATVPLVAGMCALSRLRFQLANWSSAVLWALLLLAPGAFGVQWFKDWYS